VKDGWPARGVGTPPSASAATSGRRCRTAASPPTQRARRGNSVPRAERGRGHREEKRGEEQAEVETQRPWGEEKNRRVGDADERAGGTRRAATPRGLGPCPRFRPARCAAGTDEAFGNRCSRARLAKHKTRLKHPRGGMSMCPVTVFAFDAGPHREVVAHRTPCPPPAHPPSSPLIPPPSSSPPRSGLGGPDPFLVGPCRLDVRHDGPLRGRGPDGRNGAAAAARRRRGRRRRHRRRRRGGPVGGGPPVPLVPRVDRRCRRRRPRRCARVGGRGVGGRPDRARRRSPPVRRDGRGGGRRTGVGAPPPPPPRGMCGLAPAWPPSRRLCNPSSTCCPA